MRYHVRLTEKAEQDVDDVLTWLAGQGAGAAAAKWFAKLMRAVATLESSPARCGLARESADVSLEIRELLVGKRAGTYRLLFQIDKRTVVILRVWHASHDRLTESDL